MKLSTMLRSTMMRDPQKEALVSGESRWTYAQLVEESERAAGLLADRGVRSGDRVAAMTFNEPEFVFTAFGAWMLGATLVPVNHKFQAPEVRYTVEHSEVRVGVVSAELEAIAREGAPDVDWLTSGPGGTFADLHRDAQPWREHHDDDRRSEEHTSELQSH